MELYFAQHVPPQSNAPVFMWHTFASTKQTFLVLPNFFHFSLRWPELTGTTCSLWHGPHFQLFHIDSISVISAACGQLLRIHAVQCIVAASSPIYFTFSSATIRKRARIVLLLQKEFQFILSMALSQRRDTWKTKQLSIIPPFPPTSAWRRLTWKYNFAFPSRILMPLLRFF